MQMMTHSGLHFWQWGTDGPGVLALHSMGWNGLQWGAAALPLAGTMHVSAPDLPGFGHSPALEGLSYEAVADQLAAWMADAGPQWVIGSSWGAWLGLCLAARHPHLVRGLILLDGGFWNPPAWRPGMPEPKLPVLPSWEAVCDLVRQEAANPELCLDDTLASAMELRYRHIDDGYELATSPESLLAYMKAIATAPWQDWMAQVRCPLLVLACHLDYPARAREQKALGMEFIRQRQPHATVENYEARPHLAQMHDPGWVAERVKLFVEVTPSSR